RLGKPDGRALLQRALSDALTTGEPQYVGPARLALVETAWLADDRDSCSRQLTQLVQMDLDAFDRWEFGELAVWWRRCEMGERFPGSIDRSATPRLLELKGAPQAAAEEWLGLGLPYEAALALVQVQGDAAAGALRQAVDLLQELHALP